MKKVACVFPVEQQWKNAIKTRLPRKKPITKPSTALTTDARMVAVVIAGNVGNSAAAIAIVDLAVVVIAAGVAIIMAADVIMVVRAGNIAAVESTAAANLVEQNRVRHVTKASTPNQPSRARHAIWNRLEPFGTETRRKSPARFCFRARVVARAKLCFLSRMKRVFWVFTLGGLTAISLLTGCSTTATGRHQLKLVSADQEMQLGLTAFEQMKKDVPISTDARAKSLVERVGARIAEQAKKELPDAKWEFVVFESKEANAFCLPGGKVGVYTGILPYTKTEEGLATVIGHEVAHASQHHGAERMSDALAIQKVSEAAAGMVSDKYQAAAATAFGVAGKGT